MKALMDRKRRVVYSRTALALSRKAWGEVLGSVNMARIQTELQYT
uniref:Uncharacterized protein n=1 Tax=Anguilla anguilla TaxID=7936 RepID=A0A0E9UXN6_ANGAN